MKINFLVRVYKYSPVLIRHVIPMGVITSINVGLNQYGAFKDMHYDFIEAIDNRMFGVPTGYNSQGIVLNWKKPTENIFSRDVFYNFDDELDLTGFYLNNTTTLMDFPTGTEFYFSDSRHEFADTNHILMP